MSDVEDKRRSVVSQVISGTAYGLGGVFALLLSVPMCSTCGAPASRRLSKEIVQLEGLEPVAEAEVEQQLEATD